MRNRLLLGSSLATVVMAAALNAQAAPAPGNPTGVPLGDPRGAPTSNQAIPVSPNVSVIPQIQGQNGNPVVTGGGAVLTLPVSPNTNVGVGGSTGNGGTYGGVGFETHF